MAEVAEITTGKLDSNAATSGGKYPFFTCAPETLRIDNYAFDCEAVLLAGNNATGVFPVKHYTGKFNAYQRTYVITSKNPNEIRTRYLYYVIQALTSRLQDYSIGSATKFLTLRILNPLTFRISSIPEQDNLLRLLGGIDDKIEVNRRMNETLEAIARAIFKLWFVDFDPVRAKAVGGNLGFSQHVVDNFPNVFTNCDLGDVPVGWQVRTVGDVLSYSRVAIGDQNAPAYSATLGGLAPRDERFSKQLSRFEQKNKKIERNDLVFGLSRRVLNFGLMKDEIGSVSSVYEVFKVNGSVYRPQLLERYIRQKMDSFLDILKPAAREGQAIDRHYLLKKELVIPPTSIQDKFLAFHLFPRICSIIRTGEGSTRYALLAEGIVGLVS